MTKERRDLNVYSSGWRTREEMGNATFYRCPHKDGSAKARDWRRGWSDCDNYLYEKHNNVTA